MTVVHREQTPHYTLLVLEDERGVRFLRFGEDEVDQSAVRIGDPTHLEFTYTRALVGALGLAPDAERVMIVGLGGGTIPMLLRHHRPEVRIDVLEIDAVVARVAERHMGFRPDPRLVVHIADGRAWLEASDERWDVVILDAFGADSIPRSLVTEQFLRTVRARTVPGGLVVANVWAERSNPLYPQMLATYRAVFDEVHVIRGQNSQSRIIVAFPSARHLTEGDLLGAAADIQARWSLDFDLVELVEDGYVAPGALPAKGPVLTD